MKIDLESEDREALKNLIAHAEIHAKQSMMKTGQVPPTLFIQGIEGVIAMIPNSLSNERSKDKFVDTARLLCTAHAAKATVFVAEGWLACQKKGEALDLSKRPSESPDRQEVLVLMGETRYGGKQLRPLPIIRSGSGKFMCFGEYADSKGHERVNGRFTQFLPERFPSLEDQRIAKELLNTRGQERKQERGCERGLSM